MLVGSEAKTRPLHIKAEECDPIRHKVAVKTNSLAISVDAAGRGENESG
jgi:hypothetical protein